jgi:hypothetical protein
MWFLAVSVFLLAAVSGKKLMRREKYLKGR